MNKRAKTILFLTSIIVLGTGVLLYLRVSDKPAESGVDPTLVEAAAESSRTAQQQAPPPEDIQRQGKARPGSMAGPR